MARENDYIRRSRTTVNVQSDWNATSGDAFIKNKPTASVFSHNDLNGKQGGTTDEYYHLTATEHTNKVSASSAFGTDNRIIRSDGTGRGTQVSGISVDDSNNVIIPSGYFWLNGGDI